MTVRAQRSVLTLSANSGRTRTTNEGQQCMARTSHSCTRFRPVINSSAKKSARKKWSLRFWYFHTIAPVPPFRLRLSPGTDRRAPSPRPKHSGLNYKSAATATGPLAIFFPFLRGGAVPGPQASGFRPQHPGQGFRCSPGTVYTYSIPAMPE